MALTLTPATPATLATVPASTGTLVLTPATPN